MALVADGKEIEVTQTGFLVHVEDWNESVANAVAEEEGIELTQRHWDVINYLREQYFDHAGSQPNNRVMVKDMGEVWSEKINSKTLFDLFPGNPSKQAGRIAGLPESMRKGGY